MTAYGLTIQNLTMPFGGLKALDNVCINFEAGRITGLIGPNGSGKSTLVNVMSGQLRPSTGSIKLNGIELVGKRADQIVRLGVARTYQIPRMPPQLTIREIIDVPLHYVGRHGSLLQGMNDAQSIAGFCGLSQATSTFCGQLSVPDLRRLEIARAIACGPSVLLLDETMAGLSFTDAGQVVDLARQISAAGITVILIEHVMRIITSLCEHVIVLNNGTLLASGMSEQVLSDPLVKEAYLGKGYIK